MALNRLVMGIDTNGGERKGSTPAQRVMTALSHIQPRHPDIDFLLFGRADEATAALKDYHINRHNVTVVDCPATATSIDTVEGSTKGSRSQRLKETSMHVMLDYLKKNEVHCAYSMGETGSLIGYAAKRVGMIGNKIIKYPTLAAQIPTRFGVPFLFTDVGATVDTKPQQVLLYGILCDVYSRDVLKRPKPRVAILSNGEESYKGSAFVIELSALIKEHNRSAPEEQRLNYVGFIEGKHGIFENKADIVLAEGFVGNTNLKTMEGILEAFIEFAREEISPSAIKTRLLYHPRALFDVAGLGFAFLSKTCFKASGTYGRLKDMFDSDKYNAAPLLGLDAYLVKGHHNSKVPAIVSGLEETLKYCQSGAIDHIKERVSNLKPIVETDSLKGMRTERYL